MVGQGKESVRRKIRPSKNFGGEAQAGRQKGRRVGGNFAFLLPNQNEASPATLLFKARHHRKILFSLGEKEIRRAQNEKSKEYFSVVRRASARGGGLDSLVPFKVGSRKVYNYSTKQVSFGARGETRTLTSV